MNKFKFIVVWIDKDSIIEMNENNSCLNKKKKIKESNVI